MTTQRYRAEAVIRGEDMSFFVTCPECPYSYDECATLEPYPDIGRRCPNFERFESFALPGDAGQPRVVCARKVLD